VCRDTGPIVALLWEERGTDRLLKLPIIMVQLDSQTRLPSPRLLQHSPSISMMIVPRRASHGVGCVPWKMWDRAIVELLVLSSRAKQV
jgi:hypothetical protein